MIIRAIDSNGDWTFGKGISSYMREDAAVMQDIKTRLLCFQFDCYFDSDFGIDWWTYLGTPNKKNDIITAAKKMILQTKGVSAIKSFDFTVTNRIITMTYSVKLISGLILPDTTEIQYA